MLSLLKTKDFKDIRIIHLLLGPECNMQCRHCHQTLNKNCIIKNNEVSDDVLQFLDNFIVFSQRKDFINIAKKGQKMFRISFYGGEALLHLPLIKKIVTYFMDKYDLLSTYSFRFSITTNGLGITKDFVDFVNQYQIHVGFSYDAPYPWAVRGYVSDKICDLVNQIDDLLIIGAGCAYNCDPILERWCLETKFPNAQYITRMEVLRTFSAMAEDIDTYDFDRLRIAIKKLCIASKLGGKWAKRYLNELLAPKLRPDSDWGYFHRTKCGSCISGRKKLAVGLDGKIFFCCNSGDILGSIQEDSIESIFGKAKRIWENLYDPACENCEGKEYCYWGCALLLKDNNNHAFNCEKYRKPFFKILNEEVKRLDTPLTDEEVKWWNEQKMIMKQQVKEFLMEGKRYEKEHTRFSN